MDEAYLQVSLWIFNAMLKNLGQGVEKWKQVAFRFNDILKHFIFGMLFVIPSIPSCLFGMERNGFSTLLIKRKWSHLGWKVTSYLLLHNKTPQIWWLKTTTYYFSWFCGLPGLPLYLSW